MVIQEEHKKQCSAQEPSCKAYVLHEHFARHKQIIKDLTLQLNSSLDDKEDGKFKLHSFYQVFKNLVIMSKDNSQWNSQKRVGIQLCS